MVSGVTIEFWNINGLLEENISDEALKRAIYKHGILLSYDTWLKKENINDLSHQNGYLCKFALRNKTAKKGCSSLGGFQGTSAVNSTKNYPYLINQFQIYSGSRQGKIPTTIKVTPTLPVHKLARKTRHTLKKVMQCSRSCKETIN